MKLKLNSNSQHTSCSFLLHVSGQHFWFDTCHRETKLPAWCAWTPRRWIVINYHQVELLGWCTTGSGIFYLFLMGFYMYFLFNSSECQEVSALNGLARAIEGEQLFTLVKLSLPWRHQNPNRPFSKDGGTITQPCTVMHPMANWQKSQLSYKYVFCQDVYTWSLPLMDHCLSIFDFS